MAGTTPQDLWDRRHPLSRMSERKDVHDGTVASLPVQQPLTMEINLMNHAATYCPASCEIYILFRLGLLLPKIANLPPAVDLFAKISVPVTNQYPHKGTTKVLYPPACR